MKFTLNAKEIESLNKAVEALVFLVDPDKLDRYFTFYSSGLGNTCKIKLVATKNGEKTTIEKDITDYDSW